MIVPPPKTVEELTVELDKVIKERDAALFLLSTVITRLEQQRHPQVFIKPIENNIGRRTEV
jgi:hypothetical protein